MRLDAVWRASRVLSRRRGGKKRGVTPCRHSGAASRCGAPGAAPLAGALAAASMAPMPPFEPPALLKRLAASASAVTGGSRDGAKRALSQLAVAAAVGGLAGGAAYAGMVRACAATTAARAGTSCAPPARALHCTEVPTPVACLRCLGPAADHCADNTSAGSSVWLGPSLCVFSRACCHGGASIGRVRVRHEALRGTRHVARVRSAHTGRLGST